jgi:hypothetical protein
MRALPRGYCSLRQKKEGPGANAYNDEKSAKVFILLSKNGTLTAISKETGVSESTIEEWKEKSFAIVLQNPETDSSATSDGIPPECFGGVPFDSTMVLPPTLGSRRSARKYLRPTKFGCAQNTDMPYDGNC